MDVKQAIRSRRTVHDYAAEPIDQGLLNEALELALWAPNHKMTCPWVFVQPSSDQRQQIADLGVELKTQGKQLADVAIQKIREKFLNPAELIVVGMKRVESDFQQREDYATVACGLQNASIFLWSKGIGTKWSSGGVTYNDRTYEICGIDKADIEIVGFLWVGIPNVIPTEKDRPSLNDVLLRS